MNLLINTTNTIKTGLSVLAILFFLSCKKEKNKIGLEDANRLPTDVIFTDTLSIETETILINDSILTRNLVDADGKGSYLLAGGYTDSYTGKFAVQAFSQLRLRDEFVELPAATVDSAELYINYSLFYGDSLQSQTIQIHKLTAPVEDLDYISTSAAIAYDPTPIGSVTFNADTISNPTLKAKINDLAYIQQILNGPKNNSAFQSQFHGIAFVPSNNTSGTVLRIDGASSNSYLKIYYTQYGVQNFYYLLYDNSCRKYYRVENDRSSTAIAGLANEYDKINSSLTSNQAYVQSLTGLRIKARFPHLAELKNKYQNLAIIDAQLVLSLEATSNPDKYKPNNSLYLMRMVYDEATQRDIIKKKSSGTIYYVQNNDANQSSTGSATIATVSSNQYVFNIRSYIQDILLGKLENNPVLISPQSLAGELNRAIISDNQNGTNPLKLNIYFTTTK